MLTVVSDAFTAIFDVLELWPFVLCASAALFFGAVSLVLWLVRK